MDGFVGRQRELAELGGLLDLVREGGRPGRAVLIRGRRRVGKSRLVEEFAQRTRIPHVFFTATGATPLLAVSRSGTTTTEVTALGPDELLAAWQPS